MTTTKNLFLVISFLLLCSCTDIIEVKLKDVKPQLVVEATISNINSPAVRLTQTVDFNDDNHYPVISHAQVTLSNEKGAKVTLEETQPGYYTAPSWQGEIGMHYYLNIITHAQIIKANCQLPISVLFDNATIVWTKDDSYNAQKGDMAYKIQVEFQDPANVDNYYHFLEYRNNILIKTYLFSDENNDGLPVKQTLRYKDRELEKGDSVRIEMQCITKEIYDYLHHLKDTSGQNSNPCNPKTNLIGAKLGYFSAHTSQSITCIVPSKE
jgi:hypothetical protein